MTSKQNHASETSTLLHAENRSEHVPGRKKQSNALSTEGMTTTGIVVAVGFTWLGAFLAAIGASKACARMDPVS